MLSVVLAVIALIGALFKNSWIMLISAIGFLYMIFPILPIQLKILLSFVLFLWILNMGKGRR